MNTMSRRAAGAVGAALLLSWAYAGAAAQGYPTRPIRLVVPFPPGGSADVLARTVGQHIGRAMGQQVVVENKAGAGGILGASEVASSPADGYTLLFANTNIAINPSIYKKLPYDTAKAFAPVVLMVTVPNLLLVSQALPVNDVAGLIELAKSEPGKLNYASAGNGSFPHLAIELFNTQAGVSMTHIPYNGAAPALQALLSQEVQVLSNDLVNAMQHTKTGKVKALAITGASRSPMMPHIPTMSEAGLKDYVAVGWQGIMVAAGTPPAVIARLNTEINKALRDPALRASLTSQGLQVEGGSAADFGKFIREDTVRWSTAVKTSGATIN